MFWKQGLYLAGVSVSAWTGLREITCLCLWHHYPLDFPGKRNQTLTSCHLLEHLAPQQWALHPVRKQTGLDFCLQHLDFKNWTQWSLLCRAVAPSQAVTCKHEIYPLKGNRIVIAGCIAIDSNGKNSCNNKRVTDIIFAFMICQALFQAFCTYF